MRRTPRANGRFLTLKQAESEYGLPYSLLWSWVDRGQLPRLHSDITGRAILLLRADLDAFLQRNMTAVAS